MLTGAVNEKDLKNVHVVAVDDEQSNLLLLRRVLEREGYARVETTTDPTEVLATFAEVPPDLLLLDLHMPGIDGFGLMKRLAGVTRSGTSIPILVLTADVTDDAKRRALSMGARDFLTKPIDQTELLLRVRNLLQIHLLQAQLRNHNATLERRVADRTDELERARLEILDRLALAAEFRDDDTQEHAQRIGRLSAMLAKALGRPDREIALIRRAAPLHDVGKIAIPDSILLKPGKLSDDERALMQEHATIGGEILSGGKSELIRLAERIALTHHESWDGSGYPAGLAGEEIPLAGRIVSVADVFDALTHERPYKEAWPVKMAVREILEQPGRKFDPDLVDAFAGLDHLALLGEVQSRGEVEGRQPSPTPVSLRRA
jgi:putative two-component system response regulator